MNKRLLFHVNILSDRKGLERIRWVNALPGLVFTALVILFSYLKGLNQLYLLLSLAGMVCSAVLIFLPFYANALVIISADGIRIKKGDSFEKKIKWSDIKEITFEDHHLALHYGNSIGVVIRLPEEELRFGFYPYLVKSPQRLTQEFIRGLLKYPGMKDKLPREIAEKYSE
jgi:hypothetical protein